MNDPWSRPEPPVFDGRAHDDRESELRDFVSDLLADPRLVDAKYWLHSRLYHNSQFDLILDVARAYRARLTFAFLGRDLSLRGPIIERMLAEGHEVVPHGERHHILRDDIPPAELQAQIRPALNELRAMGAAGKGIWMGGAVHPGPDQLRAIADLGIEWYTGKYAPVHSVDELRWVPDLVPHDYALFFLQSASPADALNKWRDMLVDSQRGVFFFLPFILTMLDPAIMEAWERFLGESSGSVTVSEFPSEDGRPAIIMDGSLHLHLV